MLAVHKNLQMFSFFCSFEEAREELDEFQISSRELESELEAQLEQYESRNKELVSTNARQDMEIESLRVSHSKLRPCPFFN